MDFLLFILGFVCVVVGVFGSFLPVLPGPTLGWVGLLLLYLTNVVPNNYWVLGITLLITLISMVLDYVIPAKGTKKFGGSKFGVWGTNIGMIVGFFIPVPFGFVIGAFVGALVGELFFGEQNHKTALKSATGSFLGFLASSFIKFFISIIFLGIFVCVAWQNRALFTI
ncbi:MAG: DUF456 domain-containing protein [Limnohabitans sp.]|nr:DUF456 domain-containing protein [Limnohabitans sp.]